MNMNEHFTWYDTHTHTYNALKNMKKKLLLLCISAFSFMHLLVITYHQFAVQSGDTKFYHRVSDFP